MNPSTLSKRKVWARPALQLLAALLLLNTTISCKKESDVRPDTGQIVFWTTSTAIDDIQVDCYVDGRKIGTLSKTSASAPSCEAKGFPVATVEPGDHTYEFRAANGQRFSDVLKTESGQCYNAELY